MNHARWDLCGGCSEMGIPTAIKPMSVPAVNLFSPADWYRTILDQVQHEDNLIVQRLPWLMGGTIVSFYRACCQAAGVN